MNFSRRKMLTLIGGGTIIAAGASAAAFLNTRTPHDALEPWSAAGGYEDPRKWALSYAVLAPNAHNRQPWLVELKGSDTVILWRDTTRELPETDPLQRQLVISLGCFLEQMRIAAAEQGIGVNVSLYPEGEKGPAAIAVFGGSAAPDPLFNSILDRRSCKEPFNDTPLPVEDMKLLAEFATIISEPAVVAELQELTWQAWLTEANHFPAHKETVDLMRFGKSEITANPDGISLGGPFLESLMLVGALTRQGQLDAGSSTFRQSMKMFDDMLHTGVAYAVITTNGNSRHEQIEAGRQWLRLNLATTSLGVSVHPVSQCLQEYPQMSEHYRKAHQLMASDNKTVQMLGRLGYGPSITPTPRWPLETRII